jgi:hypothetical protein
MGRPSRLAARPREGLRLGRNQPRYESANRCDRPEVATDFWARAWGDRREPPGPGPAAHGTSAIQKHRCCHRGPLGPIQATEELQAEPREPRLRPRRHRESGHSRVRLGRPVSLAA